DDATRAAAVGARLGEGERALAAADQPDPVARGARAGDAARPRARAAAAFAAAGRGQPDRHLGAAHGVAEVDGQLALDVGAPLRARRGGPGPGGRTAPEEAAEQVTEPAGTAAREQVVQVERAALRAA